MFDAVRFYQDNNLTVKSDNDGITVLQVEGGKIGTMIFYHIMPGIDVVHNKFNTEKAFEPKAAPGTLNMIEINHCRQGRFGCTVCGCTRVYLGEGEISANILGVPRENPEFPLGFYEGAEILIDAETASSYLRGIFPDVSKQIEHLLNYVSENNMVARISNSDELEHIFSELYDVNPAIALSYIRIKVIEIILTMRTVPFDNCQDAKRYYAKSDIEKVKAIRNEAVETLDKKLTLSSLSQKYEISLTLLKQCFKEIYGVPYYSYIKRYKMHTAIHYLEETELKISDIAGLLGYDNLSKFTCAFKSIVGCTPTKYRNSAVRLEHLKLFGVETQQRNGR